MMLLAGTNEAALKDYEGLILDVVLERLQVLSKVKLSAVRVEDADDDTVHPAISQIEAGVMDPVRVFVKNEPHKREKIEKGRLRLICSVSLPDNVLQRVLFERQNKGLIDKWDTIPNKPGMGSADFQLGMLWDAMVILSACGALLDTDVSGWDWSVKSWMQACNCIVRLMQIGISSATLAGRVILNESIRLGWPVFVLSDGRAFVTKRNGLQLSGQLNTSHGNSTMRNVLARLCGHASMAMGDDCTEEGTNVEETVALLRNLGFTLEYHTTAGPQGATFCSMRHKSRGVAEPTRWPRTLYRLLSKPVITLTDLLQFADEIRHVDGKERVLEWIRSLPNFSVPQVGGHEEGHEGGASPQEGPDC